MSSAFIFPGQGSQAVGMGKDLHDNFQIAREVFEEVDDALGENLTKLIFEGPMDELTLTQNTQPALMTVSIAALRVLLKESGKMLEDLCAYVAGHSLGEYSALCAAGSISLADTAKLLRIRGNAMAEAVPAGVGSMAALIGVEFDKASELAGNVGDLGVCQAANDNGGGQVVISGHAEAVDRIVEIASDHGIRKAVKLPVSAPFHCELMQPAADRMRDAFAEVTINTPAVDLVANVTASAVSDVQAIRDNLVAQVTGVVRWRESMLYLKEQSVDNFVELGSGKVLAGLIKRIDRSLSAVSIQNSQDVENFLNTI